MRKKIQHIYEEKTKNKRIKNIPEAHGTGSENAAVSNVACLACAKFWVWASSMNKLGTVVCLCNPKTHKGKQEEQKFKIILVNTMILRISGDTWNPISNKRIRKTKQQITIKLMKEETRINSENSENKKFPGMVGHTFNSRTQEVEADGSALSPQWVPRQPGYMERHCEKGRKMRRNRTKIKLLVKKKGIK